MGGYKPVDFLESTGTQYIITDYYQSTSTEVEISADCEMLGGGGSYGYVCSLVPEDSEYPWTFGLEGDGRAIFSPLVRSLYVCSTNVLNKRCLFKLKDADLWIDGVKASRSVYGAWPSFVWSTASPLTLFRIHQPDVGTIYSRPSMKAFRFTASARGKVERDFIPVLDPAGIPCMFDLVSLQPFYNQATGSDFIVGLTMKQALNLANLPVPTTSNTLTISLPKEASLVQYNQKVEAALEAAAEKGWNIAVQYRDAFEDEAILNKYAECVTLDDLIAVNPDYRDDLTSDGEWIYPVPVLTDISSGNKVGTSFQGQSKLKKWSVPVPNLTSAGWAFKKSGLTEWTVGFPAMKGGWGKSSQIFSESTFTRFAGDLSKLEDGGQMFWYVYGMTSFESTLSALRAGHLMFQASRLDKDSALRILNSIPPYTSGNHLLLIGIHIDHQFDEEVLSAITNAEVNGWTLTIQWNPGGPTYTTPEASTFGLRKPPIYAKLDTMENPDGTSEDYLDWGHYVTNWEENGYQEFASIEEAEEHFKIKKEVEE